MKKRILVLVSAIILVIGLTVLFTACDNGQKADYSATVLAPDESPMSGVTVSWNVGSKQAASATTGEDGKATALLALGSYSVTLSGYGEGLEYPTVSVSSSMRDITLPLTAKIIKYTATVTDKNGAPAANVTVSWTDGNSIVGSATTDAEGTAECEIAYGEYSVTLANLPEGNVYDGAKTVDGKTPSVRFELRNGVTAQYNVTVKSEGGLLFKNQVIIVYNGTSAIANGRTNDNGVCTLSLEPGDYTVSAVGLPDGYTSAIANLTTAEHDADLILSSKVITSTPHATTQYVIGDIIHDYTFTTPYVLDGKIWSNSISNILKTKEAVIINNWGTGCYWCLTEMPDMEAVYEKYSDQIEIIAVSNYRTNGRVDSDSVISQYYEQNGYPFPLMRDTNDLVNKFSISSWPTTIVIDRYGAIARIEVGAILGEEAWERMIKKYIGDDYVQTFVPGDKKSDSINYEVAMPDITVDPDHYDQIAAVLNNTDTFPEGASVEWYGSDNEMFWPFVLGTVDGVSPEDKVMYSPNSGKANSVSWIYANVTVEPGKVFTFDYYAETQKNADILSIVWDGKLIKQISGNSNGWQTCNLYSEITSGTHTLYMTYIKDSSGNTGKDNVYFRNVRFTELSDITESTDMFRAAAYGVPEKDAKKYPHYASVNLIDGYYHVDLSKLENSEYAGNDESPLLLVNLLDSTNWMLTSIREFVMGADEFGEYVYDCTLTINGVTRDYRNDFVAYFRAATASDVTYCIPVDKELHDLLVAFMTKMSGDRAHADIWLEACYFYSHYGSGDPIGNPILGLTKKTAIPVTLGTSTADVTRPMAPFTTIIYSFTPDTSGVYNIKSLIDDDDAAQYQSQLWLYDDDSDAEHPLVHSGDERFVRTGENEQNFDVYRYMTAGHKYYLEVAYLMLQTGTYDFKITFVGDSATILLPCSENQYELILDQNGNYTTNYKLSGAVEYGKDDDGYYHVLNPDGSLGDYIYFDVKYATTWTRVSISELVKQYQHDPLDGSDLDYKVFDFRYRIAYYSDNNEEGSLTLYDPKIDMTSYGEKYKDYTAIIEGYIAKAETGKNAGLVKVDDELVEILNLFIEMRINMLLDNQYELALENEWLRLCWYYRTYDAQNA